MCGQLSFPSMFRVQPFVCSTMYMCVCHDSSEEVEKYPLMDKLTYVHTYLYLVFFALTLWRKKRFFVCCEAFMDYVIKASLCRLTFSHPYFFPIIFFYVFLVFLFCWNFYVLFNRLKWFEDKKRDSFEFDESNRKWIEASEFNSKGKIWFVCGWTQLDSTGVDWGLGAISQFPRKTIHEASSMRFFLTLLLVFQYIFCSRLFLSKN